MNKLRLVLFSGVLFFLGLYPSHSQQLKDNTLNQLKFRHVGPLGNRVTSVVGIPGNDQVYYVGAASGGIWKTSDAGLNWAPIFEKQDVHSIGALAVAPSDPETIYAGTGEAFIRSNISIGNGIYKSMDAGQTWTNVGLPNSGRISRIIIDPQDPDIVFVAVLGHAYAESPDRGIYKSTDGGKNWKKVLHVDTKTGASDLVMDPNNPRILFAGMWQLSLKPWNRTSGGKGSGLYKSTDAGETWKRLEKHGLPKGSVGKVALAMTSANSNKVFALIETGDGMVEMDGKKQAGELWVSNDKGGTWQLVSSDPELSGRQAYYTRMAVSPSNENELYFIAANVAISIDGGKSLIQMGPDQQPNWDHHDIWIDPQNPERMAVAGDGGISISENRAKTWLRVQLPVAQVYHVTTDTNVPYYVLTNRQDGPAMRGPSRSNTAAFFGAGIIPTGLWHDVGGGESGFATPDPENPDIVWSSASGFGALGGVVTRYNVNSKQYRHVEVWPEFTPGTPAKDVKYRFQWTFPLLVSPHDHNTVYVTSQYVHRTTNGGQTWEVISPDLTLNDTTKQQYSGGLTGDNIGVEYANVIYAFEESPIKQGLFWAGTNDGQIHLSQDGGKSWTEVSKNIKDLPPYGTVRNIDASDWEEGKAYVTIDFHETGNFKPYVYKTTNFGKSWTKITTGIDNSVLSYARCIREDPKRKGLLYLGTENKLYVSFNDGSTWQSMMSNLPPAPMYWIDIQENFNDLVLGTYGRGIWILDDLSPIQQLPEGFGDETSMLFKPGNSYRFRPVTQTMQFFEEASSGTDPLFGVPLNFWLKEDMKKVKLKITNSAGDTIRTLETEGKAGINRVYWNYAADPVDTLKLRTVPYGSEWVALGKDRTRPLPALLLVNTYLVEPGTYSVHMDGSSQSFEVMKDPNSEGSVQDISEQVEWMRKVMDDMNTVIDMVNQMELVRRQVYDLRDILKVKNEQKELIEALNDYAEKVLEVEMKLVQLKSTGRGQDAVRWPVQLFEKLNYLASTVQTADFPPNDSQKEVYNKLNEDLSSVGREYDKVMNADFNALMTQLKNAEIGLIVK